MSWKDFNTAEDQSEVIPKGTLVKVRMTIKPGGYSSQEWEGGYASQNSDTGSLYLNCEFVVLEGQYARRKVWSLIGLQSPKGPEWGNMGRTFIKGILNSARGVLSQDTSPAAQNARRINTLQELDGIEFGARVDMEKDQQGNDRNVIKTIITPEHQEYAALMRGHIHMGSPPQGDSSQGNPSQGTTYSPQSPSGYSSSGQHSSNMPTRQSSSGQKPTWGS